MIHFRSWRLCAALAVAMLANGAAHASAVEAADQRQRSETSSFAATSQLAQAGDTAAMLRLGEMLWYGQGVPVDRPGADALFKRASLAGNPDAASFLGLSAEREAQRGEIVRWTSTIDARQLTGAGFDCQPPEFPTYSYIRMDVKKVVEGLDTYRLCYNTYVDRLFGDLPTAQRIPAAVSRVMSDAEFDQARERIDGIVRSVVAELQQRSAPVLKERDRWLGHTRDYIVQETMRSRSNLSYAEDFRRAHKSDK